MSPQGFVFRSVENKKKMILIKIQLWKPSENNADKFWLFTQRLKNMPSESLISIQEMKAILNLRYPRSVQHLSIHSKPSIQYIVVAWITAMMIFLKDDILVTDQDTFYQMKTYTISLTWGSSRQHPSHHGRFKVIQSI
jgi:hypothetical protein